MKKFTILCFVCVLQTLQAGDAKGDFVSATNHFYRYFMENNKFDTNPQNMTKISLPIKEDESVCVYFVVKNEYELEMHTNIEEIKCNAFTRHIGKSIDINGTLKNGKMIMK